MGVESVSSSTLKQSQVESFFRTFIHIFGAMHNTNPYGVRRAHSFDSYDNLDKLQALREHRLQFLSTRAKFDKSIPPSEPPPPPPRHASKFKIMSSSSSSSSSVSPVSQLIQSFTEELKSKSTHDKTDEDAIYKNNNVKDAQPLSISKTMHTQTNIEDKTNTSARTYKNDSEISKFKALGSPGNVLRVTQSWQKYKLEPSVVNSAESDHPLSMLEDKYERKHIDVANEPPFIRKQVDELGYEQPTFFQNVNVNRKTLQNLTNSASFSYDSRDASSMFSSHSFNIRKENTSFSSIPVLRRPSEFKSTSTSKYLVQNPFPLSDSVNNSGPKDVIRQRRQYHISTEKPKYNTQEDRRLYLESTLKMFADSLPQQDTSDSVLLPDYNKSHDLYSNKPRRISTGSMHEPTNWRSQTNIPVRSLVHKFSDRDHMKS